MKKEFIKKYKIPIIVFTLFGCFILSILLFSENGCNSYYDDYKLEFIGVINNKWQDKGTNISIDFKDGYVNLRSGFSGELVKNGNIGDTVIKRKKSTLCTLITKDKILILPYSKPCRDCNCPDTNKVK